MRVHPSVLSAFLAVVSLTSTDAFVGKVPRSKPTASKGSFSMRGRSEKNKGVLRTLYSTVSEASPAATRLSMFENSDDYQEYEQYQNYQDYGDSQNYQDASFDATESNDQWTHYEDEAMTNSFTLADADVTTAEGTPETPVSPPAATAAGAISALATSPILGASAVAFGGLAVARTALGQRQKKLDEEKRSLEDQQKRLETESAKLQKDTSQSNLFLSTVGSVAVGTALTTGSFVEEFAQSSVQSIEGIGEGINVENGIRESVKGGGFKTSAGTVVERPVLGQQELPYLETKIEQETAKQETKQRVTKFLSNRRQKLTLKQNELEGMTAKREATIAAEEQRLQAIADKEAKLRAEEEVLQRQLLAEKNEAARLQKEAEATRIKEEEQARIQKEAEEARRIRAEQEAERLRIAEEASKEQARREAIAREERALEILRQQEAESALQQQRSTASTATAAGINTLREYASKFSSEYYANQLSANVNKEKLELLLNRVGVSPAIAGGAAALLAVGGGAALIKNLLDDGDEYDGTVTGGELKPRKEEDNLSSQVEKLLETKRQENVQQSSTVKRTLRISEGSEDETATQKMQKPKSASPSLNGVTSKNPPPPSIKFGESTSKPMVTPPSPKSTSMNTQAPLSSSSEPPRFGAPPGLRSNGVPSKATTNPFENNFSKTSPSSAAPPTKKNYSVSSPKQSSFSSSADVPGFGGGPPSKNTSPAKSFGSPKSFASPPKSFGISSGGQTASPFAKTAEEASQGKQPASSFGPSFSKSASGFGFPPPKSANSPGKQTSSPFGTMPKENGFTQTSFDSSGPASVKSPVKKSIPPFNPSGKQAPYSSPKSSPFGNAASKPGSPKAFGTSVQKTGISPNNFDLSPKKAGGSPFTFKKGPSSVGTGPEQSSSNAQAAPSFGAPPRKAPPGAFGSPMPKSVGSPNGFGSPPKKVVESPGTQTASPFGAAPKQVSPTNDLVSPFSAGSSNPFGPPSPSISDQPGKKTESPFNSSPKSDFVGNKKSSPFAAYGTPQKQTSPNNDQKKPFSPFGQRNGSQVQNNPSFSSSGPVYMPPTSKVNNNASLQNVYSSLDKNGRNGSQEKRIQEIDEPNPVTSSSPKKSFSPFAGTNGLKKSAFGSPNARDVSANVYDPNASLQVSPFPEEGAKKSFSPYGSQPLVSPQSVSPPSSTAANLRSKEVKKSYSPYGRKPAQGSKSVPPKVDPSSFSFGSPSPRDSKDPMKTSSFSFEQNQSSTAKPFAATGFPPTNEDLINARNRAMKATSNGQQNE